MFKGINMKTMVLLGIVLLITMNSMAQKKSKKKKDKKPEKPEWVMSRPNDNKYYHGIGVAIVNTYTQGHIEQAKKKALNDLISEISVTVKSASIVHQIEENDELNNMYQSLTNVTAENDIEGFELVDSWGNEAEYWVYYRLSKSLYHANKLRKLDRAKSISSTYYEAGKEAVSNSDAGEAYRNYVKGLASLKEYLDEEITIVTDNGKSYLVDALMQELMALNRETSIQSETNSIKTKIARPVDEKLVVSSKFRGMPVSIDLTARFTKGSGEVTSSEPKNVLGTSYFKIQRITGGQNIQMIEVSPDIESMTGEEEGDQLIATLIRLKTNVPKAEIIVETQRMIAYFEVEEKKFGEKVEDSPLSKTIRNLLSEQAYTFTDDMKNADVSVKLSINSRKGEEKLLKKLTLYTSYIDLFISITDMKSENQVFYKGFNGEKGARSGGYDEALKDAEEVILERFKGELLTEINEVDL